MEKFHGEGKYRPANGAEGGFFMEGWCEKCAKDNLGLNGCVIIAAAMCFEKNDERYPKEWVYDKDGDPCCTAFEARK